MGGTRISTNGDVELRDDELLREPSVDEGDGTECPRPRRSAPRHARGARREEGLVTEHSNPSAVRRRPRRGGVDGNERLTAMVAVLLLFLLFLVGLTVPIANAQTRLHVFLGVLVIPPILLKIGSTTWRFVRYYSGNFSYRSKGPPAPLLRLLGPALVILTLVMLGSGIGLVIWAPVSMRASLSQIHRLSFILWFGAMTIHVLGHLRDTANYAPRDFVRRTRRHVRGVASRTWVTVASLALGVVCAVAIVPYAHNFVVFAH